MSPALGFALLLITVTISPSYQCKVLTDGKLQLHGCYKCLALARGKKILPTEHEVCSEHGHALYPSQL